MKNTLKLTTALCLGLSLQQLQAQIMNVRPNVGSQTSYALGNTKKLTFASGNMTVSQFTGSPDTYALSATRYVNFQPLVTGISSLDKNTETMALYPNPVEDVLYLSFQKTTTASQAAEIEIISVDGKVVYKESLSPQNGVYQVNTAQLPQGLYFCKLNNGSSIKATKFIKQ